MADPANESYVGEPRRLKVQWTDPDTGLVVTPTTTFTARGPGLADQSLPVSGPDANGYFWSVVTPTVAGQWWYGADCTGSYNNHVEDVFVAKNRRS